MSLIDRFFSMTDEPQSTGPSFIILFPEILDFDPDGLKTALRSVSSKLAEADIEIMVTESRDGEEPSGMVGVAAWDNVIVQLVGINAPVPDETFHRCVDPAHYAQELKNVARQHRSHILLFYAGEEIDPIEKFVAVTAVVSALARFDAILVMNEPGHTSFPAAALIIDDGQDGLELFRSLPVPILFSGFVKLEVEDRPGVWMRTYGNHRLGLPDLAMLAEGHHRGNEIFDMFSNMLAYLLESGTSFGPGHSMQIGPSTYLRLREPLASEAFFLDSPGIMLVGDRISSSEINNPATT